MKIICVNTEIPFSLISIMESVTHYMAKAKKVVRRVGRPSRKDLGMEPIKVITTAIEVSAANAIVAKYGTIAEGLRVLARQVAISKKAS